MTEWKKVQGSQVEQPSEVDTTSSKTLIYLRKNIKRITVQDELTGSSYELWEYDEATMSRDEYLIQQNNQNRADIDYIAAINDIEL